MGLFVELLRAERNRFSSLGAAGAEPAGPRRIGKDGEGVGSDSAASGTGVAAAPVSGGSADSGHVFGCSPGGERRGGGFEASGRNVSGPLGREVATGCIAGVIDAMAVPVKTVNRPLVHPFPVVGVSV